jgi:hypothetical protein
MSERTGLVRDWIALAGLIVTLLVLAGSGLIAFSAYRTAWSRRGTR